MVTGRALTETYEKVLSGRGVIPFRDFEALLGALGFVLKAQRGSHRVYVRPGLERPLPIQPEGKDAKRYQVRELRDMIRTYRIKLDP